MRNPSLCKICTKMEAANIVTLTVVLLVVLTVNSVVVSAQQSQQSQPAKLEEWNREGGGSNCTSGDACQGFSTCKMGGVKHCCTASHNKLRVNRTALTCTCLPGAHKDTCFGPDPQVNESCVTDTNCRNSAETCPVGDTVYCCPHDHASIAHIQVHAKVNITKCICRHGNTSRSKCVITPSAAPPYSLTSASAGLTCAVPSLLIVLLALFFEED
ncbi:uncharacterized protein [Littorina saxatilis]